MLRTTHDSPRKLSNRDKLSSEMHDCLKIPEILSAIFENLNPKVDNAAHTIPKELFLVLQTCRIFYDVAVKLAWKILPSIVPLIFTLPYDLIDMESIDEEKDDTWILKFQRRSRPHDWTRFHFYAEFVQEFRFFSDEARAWDKLIGLDDSVIAELGSKRRNDVLFPNLRSMTAGSTGLRRIHLFLSPHFENLHLFVDSSDPSSFSSFLGQIRSNAPSLKTLRLTPGSTWDSRSSSALTEMLSSHLCGLDLEEFHCDWSHNEDMVKAMLSMPSLRLLKLSNPAYKLAQLLQTYPLILSRPTAIEIHLNMQTDELNDIHSVLRLLPLSKLKKLHAVFNPSLCGRSESTTFYQIASSCCDPLSLKEIIVESMWDQHFPYSPVETAIRLDYEMLQPLLPFSNIRKICLMSQCFDLTDDEFKAIAMAWPRLEILTFVTVKPLKDKDAGGLRTTLRGLVWLATYCRKLVDLSFIFNEFTESDGNKAVLTQEDLHQARGHNLSFLTVGHSLINDPNRISSVLVVIFPKLFSLDFSEDIANPTNYRRWQRVQASIKEFQRA